MPFGCPVRILLGSAATRVRMHLRRLLVDAGNVQVIGHLRSLDELSSLAERGAIDLLLVDAVEDPKAAADLLQAGSRLGIRVVVLTGDQPLPAAAQTGRVTVLRRPESIETEPGHSPFSRQLRDAVLGGNKATEGRADSPGGMASPTEQLPLLPRRSMLAPELIAIGSSTGGPQALPEVLTRLANRVRQPIIITQHMPAAFTPVLANFLGRQTTIPTVQATHGMPLEPGRIHLAPGGKHLILARENGRVVCHLDDGPPENFCKPAVDPMLRSVVETFGGRALAVILTGMGQDGLLGCRALTRAGGAVLAQDERTAVVWGMPGAVAQAGLCQAVLPLNRIADTIIAYAEGHA